MGDSTDDERIIWEQETLESIMAGIDIEHHHEHVARGATHPSSVDAPFYLRGLLVRDQHGRETLGAEKERKPD